MRECQFMCPRDISWHARPLVEAAAQKGAFQPLQPGSTKNWQPLTEADVKGTSWRSGPAGHECSCAH
eukprot:1159285-Pelagomonas_calceolata.AAC.3